MDDESHQRIHAVIGRHLDRLRTHVTALDLAAGYAAMAADAQGVAGAVLDHRGLWRQPEAVPPRPAGVRRAMVGKPDSRRLARGVGRCCACRPRAYPRRRLPDDIRNALELVCETALDLQ